MTAWPDLLEDGFERVTASLHDHLDGLDAEMILWRPDSEANPIGWLAWHLSRVVDDHLADLVDEPQVWEDWRERFNLPYPAPDHGYGHTSEQVGEFDVGDPALLLGYADAVQARTTEILRTLAGENLDRIVDTAWDPPVTLGVRLVSVLNDATQHVGQIGYVSGLAARR